jgi:hypothetical protein
MIKLKSGNAKLHKSVGVWNIPAGQETCGRTCDKCYAIKAQVRFPVVMASRQRNLEASKKDDFQIDIGCSKMVRVHESGDFYSQSYVNKWAGIARSKPEVIFYAYTKRMNHFDFSEIKSLDNFVLHNSLLEDNSMNYHKDTDMLAKKCTNSFTCPDTLGLDVHCGSPEANGCTWCMIKANENTQILFKAH